MKATFQSVHFTADAALIEFIENKLDKLQKIYDNIIDAKVILKLENTGQVKDKITEIVISVPGNKLVATSTSKTFEQSADDSIDALIRQLKKFKSKKQESYKSARSN